MSDLSDRYPLTKRDEVRALKDVLSLVPGLRPGEAEELAHSINETADRSADLDDIFKQLVGGGVDGPRLSELLSAIEATLVQLHGHSCDVRGKLDDLIDRLGSAGGREALPRRMRR